MSLARPEPLHEWAADGPKEDFGDMANGERICVAELMALRFSVTSRYASSSDNGSMIGVCCPARQSLGPLGSAPAGPMRNRVGSTGSAPTLISTGDRHNRAQGVVNHG